MTQTLQLTDETRTPVATVQIDVMTQDLIQGTIVEHQFTAEMIRIFESFQEMIEHEMFGFLDQFEQYIAALDLHVLIDDIATPIYDLQVYDLKQISFRIVRSDISEDL